MDLPRNRFKAALRAGRHQLGVWSSLGGTVAPEILAVAGFDWVVIDTEHAPIEVAEVLPALQTLAAYPDCSAVVRPAINDWVLIKRHLDQGAQTLILPYVQSAEEAASAVAAMRYPPRGVRGVAGMSRASRYGAVEGYASRAEEELCLIVQVETAPALDRLEEIATVEGVDGVFIGPADLAASLGHPGAPGHPEVVAAIEKAIARLKAVGVPSGILTLDRAFARHCMELGTAFTAVAVDVGILAAGAQALLAEFGGIAAPGSA
jgi:4-hydroxy-2-oxoheptanedioate aldolase